MVSVLKTLMTNGVDRLLTGLVASSVAIFFFFFEKCVFKSFALFELRLLIIFAEL